ncbi:hypothetical protein Jiend_52060 [Micromonospora endophytica]|uniref:FAD-dependent oxidoreductase n=1 Tax=Micromonospora endophytica TaxID=515350 RepID=UPI001C339176|nr:FAD-dependent oxidoreductase [Micromonospora endophytica]BCJ61784.1 hypothetical protein Jiend_52060 [Micromonospora endophytica]
MTGKARHRVVIVGAGFGGLYAARALKRAPVDVTLINNTNHHIFEPLIYQVAAGILSPARWRCPCGRRSGARRTSASSSAR